MKTKTLLIFITAGLINVFPVIRHVPAQYSSIQSAIDAAQNGDTVLVAEGRYFENINFNGKNITVASNFIISGSREVILNTIIDGSAPAHQDSASCVRIVSGEDSTAVLEGFTLTGGKGTKWIDEHGAGTYVEGGGILITLSSPVIRNNFIVNNEAFRVVQGTNSAGGGGIRVGDGSPQIINNVIMKNKGLYGGGIVLNYCSGTIIKNNVIADNSVAQYLPSVLTFGGGGLWILQRKPGDTRANIVENNTVTGNRSYGGGGGQAGRGGGMWTGSATVVFNNNIVWGNHQAFGNQLSGNASYTYNNVEDNVAGTGNISQHPLFADSSFFHLPGSPDIDAGDPSANYNDPGSSGTAAFPSMGTLRNDIGVYGGPARSLLALFSSPGLYLSLETLNFGNILPGNSEQKVVKIYNTGSEKLIISSASSSAQDISITGQFPIELSPLESDSIIITWTPQQSYVLQDSVNITHNDPYRSNPFPVFIAGNSNPLPSFYVNTSLINLDTIDVNVPSVEYNFYVYNYGVGSDSVYASIDYNGVTPGNALSLEPAAFEIQAADSQQITFTVYPPLINRNSYDLYLPRIIFDSRFSPGTKHFEKPVRFRLKGILTDVNDPAGNYSFRLAQNYPNPFNPSTIINYEIPTAGKVSLLVLDVLGSEVKLLLDEEQQAGVHRIRFDSDGLSSGIYLYRLTFGDAVLYRKMILMR